ncbi:MAG: TolC family protein [Phycisphaerae bacterium]|nr:TolC family protein [Phycisphaerae bacterium]
MFGAIGCAETRSTHDYQHARDRIAERTLVGDSFDPSATEGIGRRIDEWLSGGTTVDEAVQIALLNNPRFQAAMTEIGAARADVQQSTLLSNPILSLGLQFPEGGGLTDLNVGFAAQIADLWQIPVRKQLAESELERVIHAVGQSAVELIADVRTRYYRVLALERGVQFTEENVSLVRRAVMLSEAQFRAGEVSAFDVNLARTGALDVQEQLIAVRGQLEQARADLGQTLGLSLRLKEIRLQDALPVNPGESPSLEELVELSLQERFDLRVAWFAVQRAEAALRLECRQVFSDVQVGALLERGERRALPGRKLLADTARASIAAGRLTAPDIQSRGQRAIEKAQFIEAKLGPTIAFALPIFDMNQAQIEKARVRVLQARQDYEARAQAGVADVQRAYAAMTAAAETLRFQQSQSLRQAQATVDGAERRYQAGEEGVLVLVQAQNALVQRRQAHVSTLRDFAVSLAQLEGAIGGRALRAGPSGVPTTQPTRMD